LLLDLLILTVRAQDASPQHLIAGEVTRMFQSLLATNAALREFLQTGLLGDSRQRGKLRQKTVEGVIHLTLHLSADD
jgi:hypothetical protein